MELVRRYVEGRSSSRNSETKSIGSLSQRLFETDGEDEAMEEDGKEAWYSGACKGSKSHPGSKSNLLLCRECDLRSRCCETPPANGTAGFPARYIEEGMERWEERDRKTVKGSIFPANIERDLICFNCQTPKLCPQCEYCSSEVFERIGTPLDSEEISRRRNSAASQANERLNYPINTVVKIQVNSEVLDIDFDVPETEPIDSSIKVNCGSDGSAEADDQQRSMIVDCLVSLDEVKTSAGPAPVTGNENAANDPGARKLNGTPQTRYINYMIVLLL